MKVPLVRINKVDEKVKLQERVRLSKRLVGYYKSLKNFQKVAYTFMSNTGIKGEVCIGYYRGGNDISFLGMCDYDIEQIMCDRIVREAYEKILIQRPYGIELSLRTS